MIYIVGGSALLVVIMKDVRKRCYSMETKNKNPYRDMTDDELINAFLNSVKLPEQEFNMICFHMAIRYMDMIAEKKWKERK